MKSGFILLAVLLLLPHWFDAQQMPKADLPWIATRHKDWEECDCLEFAKTAIHLVDSEMLLEQYTDEVVVEFLRVCVRFDLRFEFADLMYVRAYLNLLNNIENIDYVEDEDFVEMLDDFNQMLFYRAFSSYYCDEFYKKTASSIYKIVKPMIAELKDAQ